MAKATIRNRSELMALFTGLSQHNEYPINISYSHGKKRSTNINSLQHCIYSALSKYLISKGRKDCSADWIKRMLKNKFLGWVEESYTDILTGAVTQREVLRHTSDLDKGEAYHYTTQIIEWAESIGCEIKIPADSSYMKMTEEQNQ